mmetsp:Transcript_70444/g.153010  ORF Transcript_70444/g.153010 Transcript_70444/m.153010 type:complete len:143 (-) Transcript_70444:1007-1435(-)
MPPWLIAHMLQVNYPEAMRSILRPVSPSEHKLTTRSILLSRFAKEAQACFCVSHCGDSDWTLRYDRQPEKRLCCPLGRPGRNLGLHEKRSLRMLLGCQGSEQAPLGEALRRLTEEKKIRRPALAAATSKMPIEGIQVAPSSS